MINSIDKTRFDRTKLIQLKEQILSIKERTEQIWNLADKSIYQILYESNKNRLDSIAINYFGSLITYKELFERIDILSQKLQKMGVQPGEHVLISELATPEGVIAFYACSKIGAVSHLINPGYGKDDLVKIINENNIKKYITMDIFYSKAMQAALSRTSIDKVIYSSLKTSLPYGMSMDKLTYEFITILKTSKSKIQDDPRAIRWEDVVVKDESYVPAIDQAYYKSGADCSVAYTSGTTGNSKGVVATDKAINSLAIQMGITDESFKENDKMFNTLPTWIYYGLLNNIHNPLVLNLTVTLNPLFNGKKVHKDLNRYHFNHWNTVPTYIEDFNNDRKVQRINLEFLKSISTGGDFLSIKIQNQINEIIAQANGTIVVQQGYGASELLGSFSYSREKDFTKDSVGTPMIGNKAEVLDLDTGKPLGVNQTGELVLFSPTLMSRYLNKPEETEEVIMKREDGLLWYRTGDLAHINEKGEIFIDGRIRRIDMVKDENGMPAKLIPDKIKKVVEQVEQVYRCEVVNVPDKKFILKPVLFIELVQGKIYDEKIEKAILEKCKLDLPEYMQPKDIIVVDKFPLKQSTKIDWDKLKEDYRDRLIDNSRSKKLKMKM